MKNLVSIIVPVYNASQWLDICIDSICNQTHKNIEIILINDGSTDNSEQICISWQEKDSRIKYIYQKNAGVSSARNRGITEAKGEYICFIDSDDWIEKEHVFCLHKAIINNCSDISICGYKRVDLINNIETINHPPSIQEFTNADYSYESKLIDLFNSKLLHSPCVHLFKANIIKNHCIKFREDTHYGEDRIYLLEYLKHCSKIHVTSNITYNYRTENLVSLTHRYNDNNETFQKLLFKNKQDFANNMSFSSQKTIDWLYTPIFDYYSNKILLLKKSDSTKKIKDVYFEIKDILANKLLSDATKKATLNKYPRILVFFIKNKLASVLAILSIYIAWHEK